MTKPDTSIGDFIKQLNWFSMATLLVAAVIPYAGAGLFMFCLMVDYRNWLNDRHN